MGILESKGERSFGIPRFLTKEGTQELLSAHSVGELARRDAGRRQLIT